MSEVDKLFEDLGYCHYHKTDNFIHRGDDGVSFYFRLNCKTVSIYGMSEITHKELYAINEQVKELGW